MSDRPIVHGTSLSATTRETPAGATHVLTEPAVIAGFDVPAKSTVYVLRDGSLDEVVIKAAVTAGGTKVKKTARIAADRGRYLLSGALGKKMTQGGFSLNTGDPVRVGADGTVLVVFPAKAGRLGDTPYIEGTRLDWTGAGFEVVPDGEYVPDTRVEEEDDEDALYDDDDE